MHLRQVRESFGSPKDLSSLIREMDGLVREHGHAINTFLLQWVATTFAQFTADQNDLDIADASLGRFSSNAARAITGLTPGFQGRIFPFVNVGSFNLTLRHNSALSLIANRVLTRTGADVVYGPGATGLVWYDYSSQRWRQFI